jgi:hypothetical protein
MKLRTSALRLAAVVIAFACSVTAHAVSQTTDSRTIESSRPPYVASVARNRLLSISLLPTALRLDMNSANTIKSETGDFKPARYSFPHAHVPQSALSHLPAIYNYDRRRDAPIVSSGGDWVVAEYFRAGSHTPTTRFQLLGKQVQRQEQLDRAGNVTGVVVIGWARASAIDDETSDLSALGEHPAWIRVFKVREGGKKRLVALAWRKARFAYAPDTYDEPKDDELVYGLPSGVMKWKTKAEFLRAERIDIDARSLAGDAYPSHDRN